MTTKNLISFFNSLIAAKAPDRFTMKFLEQLEFKSSNDRFFIGLLKGLGFLDESGVPSQRYYDFLDQTQSAAVLADAIREAYADLFAVNKNANAMTVEDVRNKLKTLTQGQKSEKVLSLMANTFKALCDYADWTKIRNKKEQTVIPEDKQSEDKNREEISDLGKKDLKPLHTQLHYNIQIHLPETRDPAVYDAIFRSLKEHLF